MTNLSDRRWELATAFTCFAFFKAPLFDNPELDRMMLPVAGNGGRWRGYLRKIIPVTDCILFSPVVGGPQLMEIEVVRLIKQTHPQVIDYGACCVVSKDGKWVAGVSTQQPAYLFCNRRLRCLHADPLYEPIAPGQTHGPVCLFGLCAGSGEV